MTAPATPMRVVERSVYRGPNLYSRRPMIRVRLDLGPLEEWPTDRLEGFQAALLALLPGLVNHGCSYGEPGGLLRRMTEGTWLGHVIEHVAIELQSMAGGAATRGKTRSVKGRPGQYDILFEYTDETSGLAAAGSAIALVAALLPEDLRRVEGLDLLGKAPAANPTDVKAIAAALRRSTLRSGLGPSTAAIVSEARRRGIPAIRLNEASLVQLGWGRRQRRIRASVTDATSLIGTELAGNKDAAKALLNDAGLPVPLGRLVSSVEAAIAAAKRIGWPVVVKPLDGNHGRGVTTGVVDPVGVAAAFAQAARISRRVIVERELPGNDHRILVVAGKVVAVAERVPAHVVGDGMRTIGALIEEANADPRRGDGHENVLTRIVVDDATRALLQAAGLTLESVPLAGKRISLKGTANLSTGGTAIDRTDVIHPDNAEVAAQAAALIGLDVAGIDLLSPDISRSVRETGGGIVEVNAAPGLRMHLQPSEGTPRDVARPIVESLFPIGSRSRIPIFAVTGTNGKSTTARMVARILCESGHRVGLTSTSGVYVHGHLRLAADASGPRSARMVLRDPTVDVAVLETARGGMLREGLGFDYCDVGAVLNVTADHLGIKGVDTVEDLARVKSIVVENVRRRGHSILNADDPLTVRMARHARGTVVWFSNAPDAGAGDLVRSHIADGGLAALREDGAIVLYRGGKSRVVVSVADMPATLGGVADFNVLNALAAVAMTAAYGIPVETIADALRAFTTSFEDSPGRLNILDAHGIRVIVDYAHNPAAITALGRMIKRMRRGSMRTFGMVSIPGDRRDCDLIEMGALAAGIFDEIMFREAPDGRGRPAGSINALMSQGALSSGMPSERVHRLVNEEAATDECLRRARPGDLVVLMPTDVNGIWDRVRRFAAGPPPKHELEQRELEAAHE